MQGMQPLNTVMDKEDLRNIWTNKKIKPQSRVCCRHWIKSQCTCALQCQRWGHSHHALCHYQEVQTQFRKEIFFPFRKEIFCRRTYVKEYCFCYLQSAPLSAEAWEAVQGTQKVPPSCTTRQRNLSWPILATQWHSEIAQKSVHKISDLTQSQALQKALQGIYSMALK